MNRKDLHATAHRVINTLVDTEPGADRAIDPTAWRKTVRNRLRSEHWTGVLAALEAGDEPDALAERIRASIPTPANPYAAQHEPPNPSTLLKPWPGPKREPEDGPVIDDPDEARQRIAAIRGELGPAHHLARTPTLADWRGIALVLAEFAHRCDALSELTDEQRTILAQETAR